MIRALDLWLPAYLARPRWRPRPGAVTDIMLCVCDHFEPFHDANKAEALARMALWKQAWPKLAGEFQDADGCPPRHTFFYPVEQYDAEILRELAEICRLSGGETEMHLHHENDTAESLRDKLNRGKEDLQQHQLLNRDETGAIRYGFIHGNWALGNSHPQGRRCGVNDEMSVLRATGCLADFTMPSAPDRTQSRMVNRLYYARDTHAPRAHDQGIPVAVKPPPAARAVSAEALLLVQGPLGLNWGERKFGLLPRIENGDLTGLNPPRPSRFRLWQQMGIQVEGQPDWLFIKLHTHGAIPSNSGMFLGEPMRAFHRHLREHFQEHREFRLHYVTARELVNIIHAAEDGHAGNPGVFRDYRYRSLLKA